MAKKKGNNWGGSRAGSGASPKWDGEKTESITVRLPKTVIDQIDGVAKKDGINRAAALVKLLSPTLFNRANKAIPKVDQGPQRERVVATPV